MDRMLALAAGGWAPFDSPLIAFILTSLIVEMTPGPNMAYLAVLGASRGRIAGLSAVLGVALGLALAILISIYVGIATLVHGLIVALAGGLQVFLAAPRRRDGRQHLRRPASRHCRLAFRERQRLDASPPPLRHFFDDESKFTDFCVCSKTKRLARAILKWSARDLRTGGSVMRYAIVGLACGLACWGLLAA